MTNEVKTNPDNSFALPEMWDPNSNQHKRRRLAAARGLESCELCGRGVRPLQGWAVHAIHGGAYLADLVNESPIDDRGDMGWWILGPECGRKVPETHRRRWTGVFEWA